MTSSLLYAYLRSLSPPKSAFTPLYIPILNIPSSDLRLRPEYDTLFHHVNITPSHLITLSDLPPLPQLRQTLKPENTCWILVDHNNIQGALGSIYSARVHGVIDHHEDEHTVPPATDPEPRIVQKCGSCTSLVVRYCRPAWDASSSSALSSGAARGQGESAINDSAVIETWDAQVAKLALASVLIDTANLTAEGKVEAVDREAVKYLEAKILMSAREARTWERGRFYEEIDRAKSDIGALELRDVLRKDYKAWREGEEALGISSVVKPLQFLVEKAKAEASDKSEGEAFDKAIESFMNERDLALYAIMTTSSTSSGQFQRELLLQARPDGTSAAQKFVAQASSELGLEALNSSSEDFDDSFKPMGSQTYRKVWLQKEVGKSRKQVAPLLRMAMS